MAIHPVEKLIEKEDWVAARKLIRSELKKDPNDHWLLTRLALTYYEVKKYSRALEYEEKALELAPKCPLVLWDYAGTLQMLDRDKEAVAIYSRIIRRGVHSIAYGECGEGLALARGLIADSYYRQALSHQALGNRKKAINAFEKHLDCRGPGCLSIYPIDEIRKEFKKIKDRTGI